MEKINILKRKDVAGLLGVKPTKIFQLIANENLPHIKKGERFFFVESSVLTWKQGYEKRQAEKRNANNTTKEIAKMLGVSVANVYSLVKNEGLPCVIEKCYNVKRYHFDKEKVLHWFLSDEKNKPEEEETEEVVDVYSMLDNAA